MAAAALAVVWNFAAVIAVSNVDLSSMGASLLPIGLVAVGWAFAPAVDFRRFAVAGVALAALYLLMGFVSLFTHSRLLYGPVRAGRSHTFVDGPAFNGYLSGVKFTPETANEVNTARQCQEICENACSTCFSDRFPPEPPVTFVDYGRPARSWQGREAAQRTLAQRAPGCYANSRRAASAGERSTSLW